MRLTRSCRAAMAVLTAFMLATGSLATVQSAAVASTPAGIHINDGKIVEKNGNQLVLRGINHAHAWYPSQTQSFADIGTTGANSVRTVVSNGTTWTKTTNAELQNVISLAKAAKLISIVEVHDTTGYGEQAGRATLDQAANYWVENKNALIGQEDYVMVNLGNEPFGNGSNAGFVSATKSAITKLRNAGIKNSIVVDAPNWGQDWQFLMRDNAQEIFNSDPQKNVVFDIHMYQVFGTASSVSSYINSFTSKKLPLIIGEFGDYHSGAVAWEAILAESRNQGIGYLGWS